jgi:hypothetical protein
MKDIKMVFSFHKEIDRHKDAVKFPIVALHPDIQDMISEYKVTYDLFTFDANIWFHKNEYFIFFYMKDIYGVDCRIDCEIVYNRGE